MCGSYIRALLREPAGAHQPQPARPAESSAREAEEEPAQPRGRRGGVVVAQRSGQRAAARVAPASRAAHVGEGDEDEAADCEERQTLEEDQDGLDPLDEDVLRGRCVCVCIHTPLVYMHTPRKDEEEQPYTSLTPPYTSVAES